ncbi:MAG: fluoride efflux transporter CrcB [Chloroflexi bacterium]|nr:fluoride efflux transporter CrcB [Chloroflexota bacterium]
MKHFQENVLNALLLSVGGSLGAITRYYVAGWVIDWLGPSPIGTFFVNISGSFILGLFMTLSEERFLWPTEYRLLIAIGFLGSYTTFSTLSFETMKLLEVGDFWRASLNIGGSLAAGLTAVFLGAAAARFV